MFVTNAFKLGYVENSTDDQRLLLTIPQAKCVPPRITYHKDGITYIDEFKRPDGICARCDMYKYYCYYPNRSIRKMSKPD
jgi:hypothetical protein